MSSEGHLNIFSELVEALYFPQKALSITRSLRQGGSPQSICCIPLVLSHERLVLTCVLSKYALCVNISFVPYVPQLPASLRRLYNHLSFLFLKQINLIQQRGDKGEKKGIMGESQYYFFQSSLVQSHFNRSEKLELEKENQL